MPAEAIPPSRRRKPGLPDASSFDWLSRLGELEALSREQQEQQQEIEEGCKDVDEAKQRN